jgi:hypothetical protein
MRSLLNPKQRFLKYISKTDSCWFWNGGITGRGYGAFWLKGRIVSAHRFSYELYRKKIPKGKVIDHVCNNSRCVNPDHLQAITQKENVLRGIGITASNARKSHCPRGHLLDGKNNCRRDGSRECRICATLMMRRRRAMVR